MKDFEMRSNRQSDNRVLTNFIIFFFFRFRVFPLSRYRFLNALNAIFFFLNANLSQTLLCFSNIIRTVWQTVRRITNELLGVKGLSNCAFCQGLCHYSFPFLFHDKLFSNVLLSFSKLHVKNSHAGHFASKSPIKIKRIVT